MAMTMSTSATLTNTITRRKSSDCEVIGTSKDAALSQSLLVPVIYREYADRENDKSEGQGNPHHVNWPMRPIAYACSGMVFAVVKRPASYERLFVADQETHAKADKKVEEGRNDHQACADC